MILGKVIKIIIIVATRCQTLRLKCTKCDFGFSAASKTPLRELTALPPPQTRQLDLSGPRPTSKETERRDKGWRGREVKGGDGRGGIRKGSAKYTGREKCAKVRSR